ncbi:hypothetical protein [Legionella tunisiensis]|uniref:hypothetical protein n=1 Tax=Legionella tunisiensis TaxID=1034944 RepID=UPI00031F512B|nr:hypothetical protein [Legionella tunisiensis]
MSTGLAKGLTLTVDPTSAVVTAPIVDSHEADPSKLHVSGGASFFSHEHEHHETTPTPIAIVKPVAKEGGYPSPSVP